MSVSPPHRIERLWSAILLGHCPVPGLEDLVLRFTHATKTRHNSVRVRFRNFQRESRAIADWGVFKRDPGNPDMMRVRVQYPPGMTSTQNSCGGVAKVVRLDNVGAVVRDGHTLGQLHFRELWPILHRFFASFRKGRQGFTVRTNLLILNPGLA